MLNNRQMDGRDIVCRDIADPADPILPAARILYESVLDEAERIPWEWLARTPERRRTWQAGQRRSHLIVAAFAGLIDDPIGFGYGAFLPGFGGYVCYMGVAPSARGRGVGTRVFRFLFGLIEEAARLSNLPLPFVVWESHQPRDRQLWAARRRLFHNVGGLHVDGIELLTPNYMRPEEPPVRLQLFLRPWDEPADSFTANRLLAVARGLYENVYHIAPDDPLHQSTFGNAVNPRLTPAVNVLGEA